MVKKGENDPQKGGVEATDCGGPRGALPLAPRTRLAVLAALFGFCVIAGDEASQFCLSLLQL